MFTALAVFLIAFSAVSAEETCDNVGDLKPDSKYCDRFYQCTNHGWVSLQCQPPLLFNSETKTCDWEGNVDCKTTSLLGSALEPFDIVGDLKPDPKNCDRFFPCSNDGWVNLQCQQPTLFNLKIYSSETCDNVGDLKPDPKYCDRFYQCTYDGWVSLQCQPPTLFNPKVNTCDWQGNVECEN